MRSLKSGLVAVAVAGLFGCLAVVGCSADGGSADLGTSNAAAEPEEEEAAQLPPPSNSSSSSATATDAGTKDSGTTKKDSGTPDAGPPPPEAGDPCTTQDALANRPCGACGTQQAICQASGNDGGALAWSQYGTCQGEVAGGCVPGTVATEACGNCGTVQKTCTKFCAWTSGSCSGQPTNSCKPGLLEYSTAGCSTPNTYRNRTCQNSCQWSGFSTTCDAPNNPNKMTISGTVGQTVTQQWTLTPASAAKKPGDCGASSVGPSLYQQVAVEIRNPTSQKATVSIYQSKAGASAVEIDTVLWIYNKTLPPSDDAALLACDYGVEDSCGTTPSNLCGNVTSTFNFAGASNVTINAGSAILVYSAGFSTTTTGAFNLNVKTDALQ